MRTVAALALCLSLGLLPTLHARTDAEEPPHPGRELQRIGNELASIRVLLEHQLENQDLELVIRRSELASAEVADLERRLRDARSRVESLEDEVPRIETHLEQLEAEIENSSGLSVEDAEMNLPYLATELARARRELANTEQEVAIVENQLVSKSDELLGWKDLVDRRLRGQ